MERILLRFLRSQVLRLSSLNLSIFSCYTIPMLITIDTGGTKTILTAFNREGKPGEQFRFPTPKTQTDYLSTIAGMITEHYLSKHRVIDGIVVAVPGMIRDNKVWRCANLDWAHFDIIGRLQKKLGLDTPVWIENDANLAALSETLRLPEQPRNSLYVTISTGIGTGIIADGQIDPNMAMSEGGHMLVEYDGRLREWESFASGRAIHQTYGKLARDITNRRVRVQIADKISRGFLALIPVVMPDIIIIGGSIGAHFDRYKEPLAHYISSQLPDYIPMPVIQQARYPEEAVIYGCYYYGVQQLSHPIGD